MVTMDPLLEDYPDGWNLPERCSRPKRWWNGNHINKDSERRKQLDTTIFLGTETSLDTILCRWNFGDSSNSQCWTDQGEGIGTKNHADGVCTCGWRLFVPRTTGPFWIPWSPWENVSIWWNISQLVIQDVMGIMKQRLNIVNVCECG